MNSVCNQPVLLPLIGIGGHVSQPLQFRSGIRASTEYLGFVVETVSPKGHAFPQDTSVHNFREGICQLRLTGDPPDHDSIIEMLFD